ncbi:MAG: metallophosphoesterase [Ruminiclostridium sp.]|nr:metallophosphoesterase [Ruminiclostridium sp.]
MTVACFAAVLLGIACRLSLNKVEYTFETDKIDGTVKIAFLSDVHNSLYGENQCELTEAIEEYGTDIVLFGGDLFDEFNDEENSWALVDAMVTKYPCFYAVGNHEHNTGKVMLYKKKMAERGVTVLNNSSEVIEINGQKIRICGTENKFETENAEPQNDGIYSVLLHHYPHDFPDLSQKGFDLILAGHAHGGQWRIPGLINGVYAPDQGLFPEYAGGLYSENGTDMAVSRGLWKHYDRIYIPRIFNRPELLLITIN